MARGWAVMFVAAAVSMAGCAGVGDQPRMRLGSMPFPGLFTLYAQADAADLGVHRAESWWERTNARPEVDRGILYTRDAGFLDLSHVREYVDWGRWLHGRAVAGVMRTAGANEEGRWSDSGFRVEVSAPAWIEGLTPEARANAAHAAAVAFAARATVLMGTWHEVATWHGQNTVPGVSEKRSAFTWDDMTSHVVAARVAAAALTAKERNWNLAVTRALREELSRLGVVGPACESEAVAATEGVWWADGEPLRRDLDTGLFGGVKQAWVVPGLACTGEAQDAGLVLPEIEARWAGAFRLVMTPPRWLGRAAMADASWGGGEIDLERALPGMLEVVQREVLAEHGAMGDRPDFPER
jgi:hypothetical protein